MAINDPKIIVDQLQRAFANGIFSSSEATKVLKELKKDGVTDDEAKAIVEQFKAAMNSGSGVATIDVATASRKNTVNKFLVSADKLHGLPVDKTNAPTTPTGAIDFVKLLTNPSIPVGTALPAPALTGKPVTVESNGALAIDGKRVDLNLTGTVDPAALDALWALNLPNQLAGLAANTRTALLEKAAQALQAAVATPLESANKYERLTGATAAAGALAQNAASWTPAIVDQVLDAAEKTSSSLLKVLVLAGLDKATLTAAQKTRRGALKAPDGASDLRQHYDALCAQTEPVGGLTAKGLAAQMALTAISFAKDEEAVTNFYNGMKEWAGINAPATSFDDDELGELNKKLKPYLEGSPAASYVYGAFVAEAPRDVAALKSARFVKTLLPALQANPPKLQNYPLTRAQADVVLGFIATVRDEAAVGQIKHCLNIVAAAFRGKIAEGDNSNNAAAPVSEAAFDFFARSVRAYVRTADSSSDGKLGFGDFASQLMAEAGSVSDLLAQRYAQLAGAAPTFGGAKLSTEAATYVRGLLDKHMRSSLTIDNLDRAVQLVATANGGKLEGAGLKQFQQVIADYIAFYPDKTLFDFNKLERLAKCKVEGKPYPSFTVNGTAVGLAQFYDAVAQGVRSNLDPAGMKNAWWADRWGFRARTSIEILDVIAEKAARNEGPVALLRDRYPGKTIEVQMTGRDGDHEQFIYVVKDGTRVIDNFTQGSDGTVAPYKKVTTPVIMTATMGEDGSMQVKMDKPLKLQRYPLQQTYGVGDSIDYPFYDQAASESQEEGSEFSTKYKILEAHITGFTANGDYTVAYKTPDGQDHTKTLALADIRKANNPHDFPVDGAQYIDVSIDTDTDATLRSFIDDAKPIIDKNLPQDGSLLSLTPAELAERQLACVQELQTYCAGWMQYPTDKDQNPDPASKKYHEIIDGLGWGQVPFGKLLDIKRGVCRHQCIAAHLLCEMAGIDSRLASGAANTDSNAFRGFHIWQELTLADGKRYLSDQTWSDASVPLWAGAYDVDARRKEMYDRTARFDNYVMS